MTNSEAIVAKKERQKWTAKLGSVTTSLLIIQDPELLDAGKTIALVVPPSHGASTNVFALGLPIALYS